MLKEMTRSAQHNANVRHVVDLTAVQYRVEIEKERYHGVKRRADSDGGRGANRQVGWPTPVAVAAQR